MIRIYYMDGDYLQARNNNYLQNVKKQNNEFLFFYSYFKPTSLLNLLHSLAFSLFDLFLKTDQPMAECSQLKETVGAALG